MSSRVIELLGPKIKHGSDVQFFLDGHCDTKGDGTNPIFSLRGQYDVAIISAHGQLSKLSISDTQPRKLEHTINLLWETTWTNKCLIEIQQRMEVKHFYIVSCHSGALPNRLAKSVDQFAIGTTFTILSGAKHVTYDFRCDDTMMKLMYFLKNTEGSTAEKVESFFRENFLFAPFTVMFCKVIGDDKERKLSAVKVAAPKNIGDIRNLRDFLQKGRQFSPIDNLDSTLVEESIEHARLRFPSVDILDYQWEAAEECCFRANKIKSESDRFLSRAKEFLGKVERYESLKVANELIKGKREYNIDKHYELLRKRVLGKPLLIDYIRRYDSSVHVNTYDRDIDWNTPNEIGVSPMYYAVLCGKTDLIVSLLERELINVMDPVCNGLTMYYFANKKGDRKLCNKLIQLGAEPLDNFGLFYRDYLISGLDVAMKRFDKSFINMQIDDEPMLMFLLKKGELSKFIECLPDSVSVDDIFLKQLLGDKKVFVEYLFDKKYIKELQMLIERGLDTSYYLSNFKQTIMEIIIKYASKDRSDDDFTDDYIELLKFAVNKKNKSGMTPLHCIIWEYASYEALVNNAKIMLENGANVNIKDGHGNTLIMRVFRYKYFVRSELIQLLLEHGADVNHQNIAGQTIFDMIRENKIQLDPNTQALLEERREPSPMDCQFS